MLAGGAGTGDGDEDGAGAVAETGDEAAGIGVECGDALTAAEAVGAADPVLAAAAPVIIAAAPAAGSARISLVTTKK